MSTTDYQIAYRRSLEDPQGFWAAAAESPDEYGQVIHDIGNSVLLEKTFNISKGEKPLKGFLDNVIQFKSGEVQFAEWSRALDLSPSQADPTGKTKQAES